MYTIKILSNQEYDTTTHPWTYINTFEPFFDPRTQLFQLGQPTMTREVDRLASLSFTLFPDHPRYGRLVLRKTELWVYEDDQLLIKFRPIKVRRTMQNGLRYDCEETLGKMSDVMYRPDAYGDNNTMSDILDYIWLNYRSYSGSGLLPPYVELGTVSEDLESITTEEKFVVNEYKPVYDVLREVIEKYKDHNGVLVPRYTDDTIYLDFLLEEDLPLSSQSVSFGVNLADLFIDSNMDDFFTRLIPLGADKATPSADRRQGQANKLPITIDHGSTTGEIDGIPVVYNHDSIEDVEYSEIYGIIDKTVRFEDCKTSSALLAKAEKYFVEHRGNLAETVELNAVDLNYIDSAVGSHLRWMTRVPVYSELHGLGREYVIKKQTIQLDNPTNCSITLGDTKKLLTDATTLNSIGTKIGYSSLDNRIFALENPS